MKYSRSLWYVDLHKLRGGIVRAELRDRLLLSGGSWSVRVRVRVTDENQADGNSKREDETHNFVSFRLPIIMNSIPYDGVASQGPYLLLRSTNLVPVKYFFARYLSCPYFFALIAHQSSHHHAISNYPTTQ